MTAYSVNKRNPLTVHDVVADFASVPPLEQPARTVEKVDVSHIH